MAKGPLSLDEELNKARKSLGHMRFEWKEAEWLDTGYPELNEVLGDTVKGLSYGRMMEISGQPSHGKSAIAMSLAALAQSQGAWVIWGDFENSWDEAWAIKRGIDPTTTVVICPYVAKFKDEAEPRLTTAEELCTQIAMMVKVLSKRTNKMVLVVDSVAAMVPGIVSSTSFEDANLVTSQAKPKFLSNLLSQWTGMAQVHNVLVLLVNQLRQNPMAKFTDPWYSPGGNALPFHCHVRARVGRTKGGKVMSKGKQVGIQGVITNQKNKVGGLEKSKIGYKLYFAGPLEFIPAKELVSAETDD